MSSIEFKYEIEIEDHVFEAMIYAKGVIVRENNYGADADGNRGIKKVEIDDIDLMIVDSRANDITPKLIEKYQDVYDCLVDIAIEKLWEAYSEERWG